MTDTTQDDLVERLRESGSRSEVELHEDREEAADRIEELEAKLRQSALQELSALGQASEAYQAQLAAEAKLAECEARLMKAVEALLNLADCVDLGCYCSEMQMAAAMDEACATLAELKGGKNDR